MFSKLTKKLQNVLAKFVRKFTNFSKIAQSGHTGHAVPNATRIFWIHSIVSILIFHINGFHIKFGV